MPRLPSSVTLEELPGSPKFSFTREGATCSRRCKFNWTDLATFVQEQFGQTYVAGTSLLRFAGATMPGWDWMLIDTIDIEPFDDVAATYNSDGEPIHQFGTVAIKYKSPPFDDESEPSEDDPDKPEGTYLTHTFTMGAEMLSLPSSGFKWQASGKNAPDDINVGMLIPTEEHSFSWKSVPRPPFSTISDLIGKVNSGTFSGKAAETVLFLGATAKREFTTDGQRAWTLDYKMSVRKVKYTGGSAGWNHFFDPETGTWDKLITKTGSNKVYQTGDMDGLFQFSAEAV